MKRWLSLVTLVTFQASAGIQTVDYGPKAYELSGTLDLQTFPGAPSYESIEGGDEVERHFYLKLDAPINVIPGKENPGIENAEKELNVKVLQLAIAEEEESLWSKFRKLGKGTHVRIAGTLFHRFTGHHHSRILLSVDSLRGE